MQAASTPMPPTSRSMWTVDSDNKKKIFYSGVWGGKLELMVGSCIYMTSMFII